MKKGSTDTGDNATRANIVLPMPEPNMPVPPAGEETPELLRWKEEWMRTVAERLFGSSDFQLSNEAVAEHVTKTARQRSDVASYHAHRLTLEWARVRPLRVGAVYRFLEDSEDPFAADERALSRLTDAFENEAPALVQYAWAEEHLSVQQLLEGCRIVGTEDGPDGTVKVNLSARDIIRTNAIPAVETDGMLRPDAKLAERIESFGDNGKTIAGRIRDNARQRWAEHTAHWNDGIPAMLRDVAELRDGRGPLPSEAWDESLLWRMWLCLDDFEYPPWVRATLEALWLDRVAPALDREREPTRMSRDIVTTFSFARVHGGRFASDGLNAGPAILVEPPKGFALTLPDDTTVAKRDGSVVGLRQVLRDGSMRTYLATLVLYQDAGRREDGSFELLDGPDTVLDVTGVGKRKDPKGRTGLRYASKDRKAVLEHLALFSQVRVRTVGDLEAVTGDPLLDEIRIRSTGKSVCYAHSRLIVGQLQGNYIQIPRAVCRLSARDVAIGMGIAYIIRARILAYLKKGTPIEAPIREWLEAAGIDGIERASKEGRRFWDEAVAMLERVAEEGGLGQGRHHGTGPDIVFGVAPHQDLLTGYHPLLGAAKRQEGAKRQAMMVKQKEKLRG